MSEQDTTDADGESPPEDAETNTETIEDVAEEPDGDPDKALEEIADGETATGDAPSGDGSETAGSEAVDDALVERVAESDPEAVASELDGLRTRIENLEDRLADRDEEIDDLQSRLARKQADFQNYKKRQKERMDEEIERATEDLVRRLVDVRDNLKRALEQDEDADIRGGVESTLRQFDEQLERENVTPIEPDPGEEIDATRHETLATIASDQPEDTVAEVHRPGYEMAGKVIRPAQVAVSDGSEHDQ